MTVMPDPARLRWHIERDTARHGGALPVASALAWFGYIEALRQWRLLDFDDYEALLVLLPGIPEQQYLEISALPERDKDLAGLGGIPDPTDR
jgi:hypothetical protein